MACSCKNFPLPYRLQDKGVGKDAEWGSLLEKPPLRHADDTDSATVSHAVDIFVERHHLLWKVIVPAPTAVVYPCCDIMTATQRQRSLVVHRCGQLCGAPSFPLEGHSFFLVLTLV